MRSKFEVGGASCSCGVVFRLDPAGNETVLHSFTGRDGRHIDSGVTRDDAGNLYGIAHSGGAANRGVVLKLDPAGNETVKKSAWMGVMVGWRLSTLMAASAPSNIARNGYR